MTTPQARSTTSADCVCAVGYVSLPGGGCGCPMGSFYSPETDACATCPVGSYNGLLGAMSETSCIRCPTHETTPTTSSIGSDQCVCIAGRASLPGGGCGCPGGTFYSDDTDSCLSCPGFTSSVAATEPTCDVCDAGYILTSSQPTRCEACPEGGACAWNTTWNTVVMTKNYWRLTPQSDEIIECMRDWDGNSPTPCGGGAPGNCSAGHEGPECQVCSQLKYYMDGGVCNKCTDGTLQVVLLLIVITAAIMIMFATNALIMRPPPSLKAASEMLKLFGQAVRDLGPAKAKAAVTFYQIILSLRITFDLDPIEVDLENIMNVFKFFEFDWSEVVYPPGCLVGGYTERMSFVALGPILLMMFIPVVVVLAVTILIVTGAVSAPGDAQGNLPTDRRNSRTSFGSALQAVLGNTAEDEKEAATPRRLNDSRASSSPSLRATSLRRQSTMAKIAMSKTKKRVIGLLPIVLLLVFVFLPGVSRTIFSVWNCVPYKIADNTYDYYLRRDLSAKCGDSDHTTMIGVAIIYIIIWPIGMQLLFFMTLWTNRKALSAGKENDSSRATRFLTGGYKERFFYWETIELLRRLTCTGFVVLIPYEYIFLRVVMAIMVSLPILVITAMIQPWRNPEDNMLSLTGQLILIFAYGLCGVARIANSEKITDDQRVSILGFGSAKGVFLALAALFIAFLALIMGTYIYKLNELIKKRLTSRKSGKQDSAISNWMLAGAAFFGVLSTIGGGAAYGLVGGIIACCMTFPTGAALGAVAYMKLRPFCLMADAAADVAVSVGDKATRRNSTAHCADKTASSSVTAHETKTSTC